jgi:hypothetical protein
MQIGVRVLRGSDDPWFLVPVQPLSGAMDLYCILDHELPAGVELEFGPGQIVLAIETPDGRGDYFPVALRYTGAVL